MICDIDTFRSKLRDCTSVKDVADLYFVVMDQHRKSMESVLSQDEIESVESDIVKLEEEKGLISGKIDDLRIKLCSDPKDFDEDSYKSAMMNRLDMLGS